MDESTRLTMLRQIQTLYTCMAWIGTLGSWRASFLGTPTPQLEMWTSWRNTFACRRALLLLLLLLQLPLQ